MKARYLIIETITSSFLIVAIHAVAIAQTQSDKNLKYIVTGTSIQGGIGLFALPSPEILPKGKFAASGSYFTRVGKDHRGSIMYSLGIGLANMLEASALFSSAAEGKRHDILHLTLKSMVTREDLTANLLGSIEVGYVEIDVESRNVAQSDRAFLGRIHASTLFSDFEVIGNLGYAFKSGGGYENRVVWGGGVFVPVLSNVTVGVEIGTDISSHSSRQWFVTGGVKMSVLDHLQFTLFSPVYAGDARTSTGIALNKSFCSAFYDINPGRARGGRIPLLPSLEELEKSDSSPILPSA